MKISIAIAFSLLLVSTIASAQHANIGIKAGVNSHTLKTDDNSSFDSKIGFHIGLLGHFHMGEQFAFQPELVYSMQGGRFDVAGNEGSVNLDYINIPLLLQYMFDNGFRLQAGPQIGFLANAKSKIGNLEADVKDDFESIDLGLGVGLGYINPATDFGVDLRYNFGLSNINKNSSANYYNRGLQLGLFYLFNHN